MKFPKSSKPAFANKEGVLKETKRKNQDSIYEHVKSMTHINIIANLKKESVSKKRRLTHFSISQNSKDNYLLVTSKMLRSVYTINKLTLPFDDHEKLVYLQKLNGVELGYHHYERTGCVSMTLHLSKCFHEILIDYLIENKNPISLIVDDTTDKGNNHFKIVYFQTIEDTNPVIYFYKLIETKSEKGISSFEAIRDAFMSERRSEFHEYMQNNLVGFASDGAPANVGKNTGTIKYIRDWAKSPIFAIHCLAHRLELAVEHAFNSMTNIESMNKISEYLDRTIRKIHSFYNKGFKRKNSLKTTCQTLKVKFVSLSDIIPIRWVASDFHAMNSIHRMWIALVKDFEVIENDRTFQTKTKVKARMLKYKIIGKNFLVMFYFILDIMNELSFISQNMQKRQGLVINIQNFKNNIDNILFHLKSKNGKYLEFFLNEAICNGEPCHTIENYTISDEVIFNKTVLVEDESEIPDISIYRTALIDALLSQFNSYFPDGHLDSFSVFDPKNIPDPNNYVGIRTYGLSKIKELNQYFKVCENEKILKEWQSVLANILAHPNFCVIKSSLTTASAFWSQTLKWAEWEPCIKRLLHIVLSLPISSAEAERGFSTLKYIRDDHRNRLTPKNMDAIMRLKINGPDDLANFPAEKYAKKWIDGGHLPTDKNIQIRTKKNIDKSSLLKSTLF